MTIDPVKICSAGVPHSRCQRDDVGVSTNNLAARQPRFGMGKEREAFTAWV